MSTMSATDTLDAPRGRGQALIGGAAKFLVGIFLCLTPVTAVLVLGWLTRKTASDIRARGEGEMPGRWPNWILSDHAVRGSWLSRWTGGLTANFFAGLKAWAAVLALTLPFSLVWLAGWFAGWENSFSKGYELSAVWPSVSLLAVVLALPAFVLLPMGLAHQALNGTISSIFELRQIVTLIRAAGWRYLGLTVLIGIGCIGVLGVRGLPVFAEEFSAQVANAAPEAITQFTQKFAVVMTALLFTGLLVIRHVMARVYATAHKRYSGGKRAGRMGSTLIFGLAATLWLGAIFLIYVAQFLNYNWWSWINQPVVMLPWLGVQIP